MNCCLFEQTNIHEPPEQVCLVSLQLVGNWSEECPLRDCKHTHVAPSKLKTVNLAQRIIRRVYDVHGKNGFFLFKRFLPLLAKEKYACHALELLHIYHPFTCFDHLYSNTYCTCTPPDLKHLVTVVTVTRCEQTGQQVIHFGSRNLPMTNFYN